MFHFSILNPSKYILKYNQVIYYKIYQPEFQLGDIFLTII